MCGILGYLDKNNINIKNFSNMLSTLKHRGPDDDNYWIDQDTGLFIGHTRLSILDLSKAGQQPMNSNSNRYIISFNGEIYNHLDLRNKINKLNENTNWKGTSDTETILQCFDMYGISKTFELINGMFAIAVFDKLKKIIYLARDRFGEKPLHYGVCENKLFFSSELKPLKYSNYNVKYDQYSFKLYLKYGYIPAPHSIYANISKVLPGEIIEIELSTLSINKKYYWRLESELSNREIDNNINENNLIDKFQQNLLKAIESQTISDVGFGVFLSSGLDSTLICTLLAKYSNKNINTFSLGSYDNIYNESEISRKISKILKTNHNEYIINENELEEKVFSIPKIYDEPFADSSQIPMAFLSENAVKINKVFLTGDGGDEMLSGYNRHYYIDKLYSNNLMFKNIILVIIKLLKLLDFDQIYKYLKILIPTNYRSSIPSEHLIKLEKLFLSKSKFEAYQKIISLWDELSMIDIETYNKNTYSNNNKIRDKIVYYDMINYLPNDILTKVDRASMFYSLETRAPYLDNNFFNFINSIPNSLKNKYFSQKQISKNILSRYLPEEIVNKPKIGFGIPVKKWINNNLKNIVIKNLSNVDELVEITGFLNLKNLNIKDVSNNQQAYKIWNILMLKLWLKEYN